MGRRGLAAAFVVLAMGGPAAAGELSETWRTQSVPAVRAVDGPKLSFDMPLGALERDPVAREYRSASLGDVGHGATALMAACTARLDAELLVRSVRTTLTKQRFKVSFSAANPRHVLVLSQPTLRGAQANFYSYSAALEACQALCRLRVAAKRVTAPVAGEVIRLSQATYGDDDVTALLLDAADPAVRGSCSPSARREE